MSPTPPPGPTHLLRRVLVAALLALGCALVGPPTAWAHSDILSVDPADGTTLTSLPEAVTLTFTDAVLGEFTQVEVRRAGSAVDVPPPVNDRNVVRQPLPADLDNGTYTVVFRIVSADSHPISGSSTFTLADPAKPAASAPPTPTPTPTPSPAATGTVTGSQNPSNGEPSRTGLIVGALVVAVVVVGAGAAISARRRRAGEPRS